MPDEWKSFSQTSSGSTPFKPQVFSTIFFRVQSCMTLSHHESIPDPGLHVSYALNYVSQPKEAARVLVSSPDKRFPLDLLLTINHWRCILVGILGICIFRESTTKKNLLLNSLPIQTLSVLMKDMMSFLGHEIRCIFSPTTKTVGD